MNWHYDSNQNVIVDDASFVILRSGEEIADPTLEEGEDYDASVQAGKRNVTVKVVELGFELDPNQQVLPYAKTKVDSETYTPPESLKITEFTVLPGESGASVSWKTNLPANGTLFIYNTSSLLQIIPKSESTFQSVSVEDLKSNSEHSAKVKACDERGCVESEKTFKTESITPNIYSVKAVNITNNSARIIWKTDVESDSKVYYRKLGTGDWKQVPPPGKYDSFTIIKYFEPPVAGSEWIVGEDFKSDSDISKPEPYVDEINVSKTAPANVYSLSQPVKILLVTGPITGGITDPSLFDIILKMNHSVNLIDLEPETAYEFFASSCLDLCANSSVYLFNTTKTIYDPYADIFLSPPSLNHGTSLVVTISAYSKNPGGTLTDAVLEWDDESTTKSLTPYFGGDNNSFVPKSYDSISIVSLTFTDPGVHKITLKVKDSFGKTATVTKDITVTKGSACKDSSSKYYPSDTTCSNKWPYDGQATIDYNQVIGACHAFEVCDDSIDYMIADAESCCNGQYVFSDLPEQTSYGYDKKKNCDLALADTRMKKPMIHLNDVKSMKVCKTSYLVHGIGSSAIYLKDYYRGEACCKDNAACGANPRFVASPWPASNVQFSELWCHYTLVKPLFSSNYKVAKDGWYSSDTDPKGNNNAMLTTPTHSTINLMNTGTCVDYSLAVTTALRKSGYKKNEILSAEAPGHMYNFIWIPGESKYSLIDTVGNSGGEFFTGGGWTWNYKGAKQDHCSYKGDRCGNDLGFWTCPAKSEVSGC
jgi:hypothetical protein